MSKRTLRRVFAAILIAYAIGVTMLIMGCSTTMPDDRTQVFLKAYPDATDIHQDKNYIESYVGDYKIAGIVVDGEWHEKLKRPRRDGLDFAEAGQLADVGTTALGIAQGFTELNPLGIAILPLKHFANTEAEQSPHCAEIKPMISGAGWGAATANIITLMLGVFSITSIAGGVAAGVAAYHHLDGADGCETWLAPALKEGNI